MSNWRERATPESSTGSWRSRAVPESLKDAPADFQPSGQEPPSNPSFEVAGRYNTPGATPSYAPPPSPGGASGFSPTRALLTNEPTQGIAEDFVRGAPAALGGIVGGGLGLAGGAAAAIPSLGLSIPAGAAASIGLAGLGGVSGESVRQGAAQMYSAATGNPYTAPDAVFRNVGAQGLMQAGGQAGGLAVGPIMRAAGRGMGNVAEYTAKNIAGVSKQSYDFAKNNIATVAKYVGASPEQANALASQLRGSIDDAAKAGENYYREVVERIVGDGTPNTAVKIDARKALSGPLNAIKKQFGYDAPIPGTPDAQVATGLVDQFGAELSKTVKGRAPVAGINRIVSPDEAKEFAKFSGLINDMAEATPQQVYYLQRDLNGAIERAYGTPLAAALKQLRSGVREMVEANAADLPDLVDANRAYASAQELREVSKKLVNANDLVGEVRRIFSNEFATGKKAAIEEVASRVPAVGQTVNELRGFNAAASFDPYFRSLPQTGMGAGLATSLVGGGVAAGINPLTLAVTVPGTLMASPRAQFAALKYGTAAAGNLTSLAGKVPNAVYRVGTQAGAGGAGSALAQEYGRLNRQIPQPDPAWQAIGGMRPAP